MNQRNIPGTNQTAENQYQSVQGPLPHGLGIFGGNVRNSFQLNAHVAVPVPMSTHIIDGHHLPIPYGGIVPHPGPSTVTTPPNFYNPYMNPGSFSAPPTYGQFDHLPYHGNLFYGVPTKIKNAEIHSNFQNASASTSSGSVADNPGPAVAVSDHFPPRFIMGPVPSTVVVGSRVGPPAVDSVMVPGPAYMIAGSYLGQPFLPPGHLWSDQPRSLNQGDVAIRPWSQLPAPPLLPAGGNIGRSASRVMNVQGYQDMASNSSTNFLPPTLPPPPLAVVGTPNANFYPVAGPSYRGVPANITPQGPSNLAQEGLNSDLRPQGTVLPTGIRIYRPQRGPIPDTTARSQSTPYLRVMPHEEVAEFVIPDGYQEVDADRHRDMRMDIEHMSYEELLALGDRIGSVSTGLTVDAIRKNLKTKIHRARSTSNPSREKFTPEDRDFNSCIICQSDFEDKDTIGILSCRHEYHTSCLEQWLLVKNVCPICKSSALVISETPKA